WGGGRPPVSPSGILRGRPPAGSPPGGGGETPRGRNRPRGAGPPSGGSGRASGGGPSCRGRSPGGARGLPRDRAILKGFALYSRSRTHSLSPPAAGTGYRSIVPADSP